MVSNTCSITIHNTKTAKLDNRKQMYVYILIQSLSALNTKLKSFSNVEKVLSPNKNVNKRIKQIVQVGEGRLSC